MKTLVKLSDFDDSTIRQCLTGFNSYITYGKHIAAAIKHQKTVNLRYNTKTGKVSNNVIDVLSSFSHSCDIPENPTGLDIITWQLCGDILNSASRLSRGCSA